MFEALERRQFLSVSAAAVTQSPVGGAPAGVNQIIQAEDFDTGGEGVAYHDTTAQNDFWAYRPEGPDIEASRDVNGGLNVGFIKAGEWLEYTLNVPADGTYNAGFRVANMRGGGSFHLTDMNTGQNLTGSVAVPNTGNWQTYQTVRRNVTLTAGTHVLRMTFDTNASSGYTANFNWLTVNAPDPSPVMGPQTPFQGDRPFVFARGNRLELEFFDNGGEGVAYHDSESQNFVPFFRGWEAVEVARTTDGGGRGLNVDMVKAGEWLEYTVNVPTAGTFDVNFRVSNIRNGGSFHLTDGGTGADLTGSIAVPSTGDWQRYTTVTRKVTLSAGVHVLRLSFDTNSSVGWVGNFNWMSVS
jgi:hypothetical protein